MRYEVTLCLGELIRIHKVEYIETGSLQFVSRSEFKATKIMSMSYI